MALITCPACGNSVSERALSCPRCGDPLSRQTPASAGNISAPEKPELKKDYDFFDFDRKTYLKKRSGDDPEMVGQVMDKWNWGAFTFTWIWGAANGIYWTLLLAIPVFGWFAGLAVAFVLGKRGNRLAWESKDKEWDNLQEFVRVQRFWAIGAAAFWSLIFIIVIIVAIVVAAAPEGGYSVDLEEVIDVML